MNDKKMIIRNCPAIYGIDDGFFCSYREDDESEKYCYDCTDCVMKQIVELCKGCIRENEHDIYRAGRMSLAVNILGKLNIQEVK